MSCRRLPSISLLHIGDPCWTFHHLGSVFRSDLNPRLETGSPDISHELDDISIANSRIVLGDTSTSTNKQVILDTGTSPLFQNNGSILYLKEDGVYRMTTNSMSPSAPERILYFDGYTVTTQSRIALSPDEKYLAVTNPATPHLDVYKIMHPESADVVPVRVLSETNIAFWPVFSPDSKSLAYIRYAFNGAGQVAGKNISVYDLNTGTSRVLFDLTSFADDYLSLTSWTTK